MWVVRVTHERYRAASVIYLCHDPVVALVDECRILVDSVFHLVILMPELADILVHLHVKDIWTRGAVSQKGGNIPRVAARPYSRCKL